jgi:hypothetical protein
VGTHRPFPARDAQTKQRPFPPRRLCCPHGSTGTTAASDAHPARRPLPGLAGYRARRSDSHTRSAAGPGGPPQFPPSPSERSTPHTPGSPSRLRLQALHRFHGLHPDFAGSALPIPHPQAGPLTTPQASLHAADRSVASTNVAFDTALRRRAFPPDAGSLLPGLLAATRTGLPPAGDDELHTYQISKTPPPTVLGARNVEARQYASTTRGQTSRSGHGDEWRTT